MSDPKRPDDIWSRLEQARRLRARPVPPHLRMTAAQIRAEIAKMTPGERDRVYAEVSEIHRQLHRRRREPEDVAAIFTFIAGLACIIASPFVGDDVGADTFLSGATLLVITIISWVIATRLRDRRR